MNFEIISEDEIIHYRKVDLTELKQKTRVLCESYVEYRDRVSNYDHILANELVLFHDECELDETLDVIKIAVDVLYPADMRSDVDVVEEISTGIDKIYEEIQDCYTGNVLYINNVVMTKMLDGVFKEWMELFDLNELDTIISKIKDDLSVLMPPVNNVFEPFKYFKPSDMVGAIMGQEPYPKEATGLAFSKRRGSQISDSFENVLKCLRHGSQIDKESKFTDLRHWAAQGILLLGSTLTATDKSGAHAGIWKGFIQKLCKKIFIPSGRKMFIVLWGQNSQAIFEKWIDTYHLILKWSHPSPRADRSLQFEKKFESCTNFNDIDKFLLENKTIMHWDKGPVYAFTDGACTGNGKPSCKAGSATIMVGAHIGPTWFQCRVFPYWHLLIDINKPSLGVKLDITKSVDPTNNRAELLAIYWAMLIMIRAYVGGRIYIYSDSKYAIDTLLTYYPKHQLAGTTNVLKNLDLLHMLDVTLKELRTISDNVEITHVTAHRKEPPTDKLELIKYHGNMKADSLAKEAIDLRLAMKSTLPILNYIVEDCITICI